MYNLAHVDDALTAREIGSPIRIRLLGELRVTNAGCDVELPASRKTRLLLAYLAMAVRPQRRERLCELLWDLPDDPRAALRWSLSRLRGALACETDTDGVVVADRQSVALQLQAEQVDLLQVREVLKNGVDRATTPALRQAAAMFQGPFLAGLEVAGAAEVQSWIAEMRAETSRLHAAILTALDDRHASTPADAIVYARALVQLDPSVEDSWARLVERLSGCGRRREAEDQYAAALQALAGFGGATHILEKARRGPKPVPAAPVAETVPAEPTVAAPHAAPPAPPSDMADADMRQDIRFCRASGGARIAYALAGQGPPLVKAANWMNHLEYDWESPIWGHFLRGMASDHTLLRYDARGNGLSDWEVDELSLEAWVADLEAVVDAAGYDRFPLLGVSQGCAISIAYAARHPERVSHLILYAGFAAGAFARNQNPAEVEQRRAMATLVRLGWGQPNPAFRQIFTSMFMPEATREQADAFNELQRRTTSPECAARYFEASAWLDVRPLLDKVTTPTLVMHPRGDANVSVELGRQMAAGIPGARFVPLSGQNHLFLEGEPAEARFFEEMRLFLAQG